MIVTFFSLLRFFTLLFELIGWFTWKEAWVKFMLFDRFYPYFTIKVRPILHFWKSLCSFFCLSPDMFQQDQDLWQEQDQDEMMANGIPIPCSLFKRQPCSPISRNNTLSMFFLFFYSVLKTFKWHCKTLLKYIWSTTKDTWRSLLRRFCLNICCQTLT